jgi:bifunctional non-homologous end joining protein LigD
MARAPLPEFIEPQLATLVDCAPAGVEWLHEIKFDGYPCRRQAEARQGAHAHPQRA